MPLIFANPPGFWALLGIPAVLLIHFLQRESRRLPVSTLFLLEAVDRESVKGRKFDRFRQSVPLWLQLLGVLILTWLLAEPRWTSARSVQRVVIVIDSSASMEAFTGEVIETMREKIPPLTALVGTTEYSLIESTVTGSNLYRGTSFEELISSLTEWRPSASAHSPEAALRVGRSLAGAEGTLIFVTDHVIEEIPFGSALLSVGSHIANVGFAGLRVDQDGEKTTWQATLRNYSDAGEARSWFLASGQQRTEPRSVELAPGETRTLQGQFPADGDRLTLVLEPDRFPLDDTLHIVKPTPKPLLVSRAGAPNLEPVVGEIINSLENASQAAAGETPDLVFASYNPLQPGHLPAVSIVFLNQEQVPKQFFAGPIVAANHPLIDDLDWQGLIARSTPSIPLIEGEKVLLWQGNRALVLVREGPGRQQLIFNFDVAHANAPRLPAFVILIHRFVQQVRGEKIGLESLNAELRQSLTPAHHASPGADVLTMVTKGGRLSLAPDKARYLRAPDEPGFFQLLQGDLTLLNASANFADTREADFSGASVFSDLEVLPGKIIERQTVADPFWQLWLVVLSATALLSWSYLNRPARIPGTSRP